MALKAPKGTKDIMPSDTGKWQYIEEEFAEICREYGFGEIRTPMFESTDLFNRGVGETTDIVQKEMYTFEDHGHRSITLKPEGTSPAVRAFIESKEYAESQPTRYWYNTPCFRYEKPQAGRLREKRHAFFLMKIADFFNQNRCLSAPDVRPDQADRTFIQHRRFLIFI